MEILEKRSVPGLKERHMRALERITDPALREAAAIEMAYMALPEGSAEAYVNAVLHPNVPPTVRTFLMALESSLPAGCDYIREDAENCVKVTVRCPY